MKSTKSSADVLSALVAERQKFEQWIAALDAKKASTPPKVYERVHADYATRLAGVMEELSARSAELESQRNKLKARSEDLSEQEALQREERAEAELRNTVGEYSEDEWKEASRKSDETIAKLVTERGKIDAELASLERILAGMSGSATPAASAGAATSAAASPPAEAAKAPRPESGSMPRVTQPPPAAPVAPPGAAAPPAAAAAAAPAPSTVSGTPLGFPSAAASGERVAPPPRATPASSSPAADGAAPPAGPRKSFDELAFLKSVVPEQQAPPAKPAKRAPSPSQPELGVVEQPTTGERARYVAAPSAPSGEGPKAAAPATPQPPAASAAPEAEAKPASKIDSTLQRAPTAPPLRSSRALNASDLGAAGVENLSEAGTPKNETPAFLKNVPAEQAKALKCGECGAMNYATEWYCERCGAELSAL